MSAAEKDVNVYENDAKLYRECERLHTAFIIWLCLLCIACLVHLFIRSFSLTILVGVAQIILAINALRYFKSWREYSNNKRVKEFYEELEYFNRKAY